MVNSEDPGPISLNLVLKVWGLCGHSFNVTAIKTASTEEKINLCTVQHVVKHIQVQFVSFSCNGAFIS